MRTAALAALLAFAAPAFACTDAVKAAREELIAYPDHSDAREQVARDCARAGRPDEALAQYDQLLKVNADNPDWLLGRAQALMALERPAEALPDLERARRLAPAYEDVWRVNVAALERLDRQAEAEALLGEARRAFPAADWPAARLAAMREQRVTANGDRLSLGASYEDLSDGLDSWKGATIDLSHPLDARNRLHGGLNGEQRFDESDFQFIAGWSARLDDRWSASFFADYTANADFLPDWSATAELGRALPGHRALSLRARHTEYEAVDVESFAGTVEQYLEQLRISYTLTAASPTDLGWSWGHVLRMAHDYGDGSHATLALGYGKEAETVAPGVVLVTKNKSVSVFGVHWRDAAWGIAWEAGWYEQGDLYNRLRIRLGVERRF